MGNSRLKALEKKAGVKTGVSDEDVMLVVLTTRDEIATMVEFSDKQTMLVPGEIIDENRLLTFEEAHQFTLDAIAEQKRALV